MTASDIRATSASLFCARFPLTSCDPPDLDLPPSSGMVGKWHHPTPPHHRRDFATFKSYFGKHYYGKEHVTDRNERDAIEVSIIFAFSPCGIFSCRSGRGRCDRTIGIYFAQLTFVFVAHSSSTRGLQVQY